MIEIKRKENEPINAFLFRFSKKVKQSGILREMRRRRYKDRNVSKFKRKQSAIHRDIKKAEYEKSRKAGLI